jgi:hypothetical protein
MRTPHQCGAAMLARWVCVGCETVYCSRTDELCARSTWLNWIGSRHADRQRCADSDDEIAIAVLLMRNSVITGGIFRRPENATAVGETASICTSHFPPKSPPTGSVPYFLAATSFARSSRSVQSGRSDGSIHPAAPTRPHRRARTLVRVARDLEGLPIAVLTGNRRRDARHITARLVDAVDRSTCVRPACQTRRPNVLRWVGIVSWRVACRHVGVDSSHEM